MCTRAGTDMDDIDFRSEHALKILKDEKCPKCEHDLTFTESDGVSWETWHCYTCDTGYEITIEITRHWDTTKES